MRFLQIENSFYLTASMNLSQLLNLFSILPKVVIVSCQKIAHHRLQKSRGIYCIVTSQFYSKTRYALNLLIATFESTNKWAWSSMPNLYESFFSCSDYEFLRLVEDGVENLTVGVKIWFWTMSENGLEMSKWPYSLVTFIFVSVAVL